MITKAKTHQNQFVSCLIIMCEGFLMILDGLIAVISLGFLMGNFTSMFILFNARKNLNRRMNVKK